MKELMPLISNCMAIGDRMKFLSMLVTLKTEVDGEGLYIQHIRRQRTYINACVHTMRIINTCRYTNTQ